MQKLRLPGKVEMDSRHILFFQSSSNYTQVFSVQNQKQMTVALSLCHVTKRLDQNQFIRVNRSTVINISYIQSLELRDPYLIITLKNGCKLKSSRRRTEEVLKKLYTGISKKFHPDEVSVKPSVRLNEIQFPRF
jgi:DNA-binding LytR/AlgR family response regulator